MQSGRQETSDVVMQSEIAKPVNAYQAFQLARYHFQRISLVDMMKSRAWLEEALRIDDQFAPAYVALAEQIIMEGITGLQPPADSFPKAKEALGRASDLKLDSAESFAVAGFASLICDWNFSDAETKLRKALNLNPHHTFAHKYLGEVLMFQGRSNEAETYLQRALDIEPMSLHVGIILILSYFLARNFNKVIAECEKSLAMSPRFVMTATYRCLAWEQLGRVTEAIASYQKILQEPDGEIARRFMGYGYALAGDREKALETIVKLDDESRQHYLSPTYQANVYAGLNENTKALSCLEKALSERDPWLLWIGTDPRLDNLRRDSRFNELLNEVGLGRLAQIYVTQPAKRAVVMPAERWQQIDILFHETLACPPAERTHFLATECAGDEALRHEIESLLSSLDEADDFIETPAGDVAAEMLGTHRATYEPGQQIENYRIVRQLGSGGMGEVYLAEDTRLNRKVALKLLPPRFTVNPDRVRRFEREARAASALNHPNIVTIYEIGQSNATHFIATEFVDGKTLRQLINEKPFTLNETLNVSMQVADALSGAHGAGIVHRDIKPENIMIRHDGYVKILDFGLAKLTEQQTIDADLETPTLLQSNPGLVMGTVQYMSPEQARAKNVGPGTDIWSLGIVMYELLAGHVPFTGETPSHVMVALMEDKLPPLKDRANVPEELDRLVTQTLQKNQKDRYRTAGELARDLKNFKQNLQHNSRLKMWLKSVPSSNEAAQLPPLGALAAVSGAHRIPHEKRGTVETTPLQTHPTSSAEYIVTGISRHKRAFALVAAVLLMTITMTGYFFFGRNTSARTRSLAVLPFNNAGKNPDLEYLSDGLSESLTNNLSLVPGLTVIARYSSFRYKGKEPDPQEVGKSLGVDTIVTGSVYKVGDNYLISVELISASDRNHIWGKKYNRKAADLLIMQSEISREIADQLRLRLTQTEEQQLNQAQAINPQAYDLYLKAHALWNTGKSADQKKSVEYYQQVVAVDPTYALAYADMARAYSDLITNNDLPQKEFAPKAEEAAQRAWQADPNLAESHLAIAKIEMNKWEWSAAEVELKKALELNPNLVAAHRQYGVFLRIHGRVEEGVAELTRAQQLDPLRMSVAQARVEILSIYRQDDQALEGAKQILQANPNKPGAHIDVGQFYARLGRNAGAIDEYLEAIRLGDETGDVQLLLGWAYAKNGQRDKALEILRQFQSRKFLTSPFGLAMLYVGLGDNERAFAALEEAYAMHDQQLIWLRGEWAFDSIRSDPRFESLVQRVGL